MDRSTPSGDVPIAAPGDEVARRRCGWAVPAVVAIASLTRIRGLSRPGVLVFDEQYWVTGAVDLMQWGSTHGQFRHPPLGQWIIASGIATFGLNPLGWRIAAFVLGVATVGLVAATVRRLCRSELLAFVAGSSCALDGVMFTTGRVAMLDVSFGFFVSAVVYVLVCVDRAKGRSRRWIRSMTVAALVLSGMAMSVKWYGALTIPIVVAVMVRRDRLEPSRGGRRRAVLLSVALAVVVPMGVYLASWAPQQFGPDPWTPASFVETHVDVARYHLDLRPTNTNSAPASTWFTMSHPTVFYAQDCANPLARRVAGPCHGRAADTGAVIMVFANPLVWLLCLAALVGLALRFVKRRRQRSIVVILLGIPVLQWLPWLIGGREAYTFYLTTIIPSLLVGAAWLVGAERARRLRWVLVATVVGVAGLFVFFYPVWTGQAISNRALAARMWWWSWPG